MFQNQPLTTLFVIATLALDGVLMVSGTALVFSPLAFGLVLGQVAALAIWGVRGQTHRLARLSLIVVAVGMLSYTIGIGRARPQELLTFYAGYTLPILLATLLSNKLLHEPHKGAHANELLQIPLIEFFGWTTLVAIVSFGARHMSFSFLNRPDAVLTIGSLLIVPVLVTLFVSRDLRELRSRKALGLVLAMLSAAIYLQRSTDSGSLMIFAQTGYLIFWLAVAGMDDVLARVKRVSRDVLQNQATDAPKLFDSEE